MFPDEQQVQQRAQPVNEIFHQDNISSQEMYALKTYKLAQDADKVWNGKKMKSSRIVQQISNSSEYWSELMP